MHRRDFLRSATLLSAAAGLQACGRAAAVTEPAPVPVPPPSPPAPPAAGSGLRFVAGNRGILFGAGVNGPTLLDADLLAAHVRESGLVVPMGLGQLRATRPTPTTHDFTILDAMWSWAQSVSLPMRGIHLVWHQNLPDWFSSHVTRANALRFMEEHITTTMQRYAGRFQSWSPVNEAIFPQDGLAGGLRASPWLELLGPDYIAHAFRFAAAADPSAFLIYNELNIEHDIPIADRRRAATLQLLTKLVGEGVPIHGLGMQAHLDGAAPISATKLRAFMDGVAALGLKILVTELDVRDRDLPADVAARDAAVAATYHTFLRTVAAHPAVTTVITWGLSDRVTWLDRQAPRNDGLKVRPLPLDESLERKPAWTRIVDALNGR
jgi:endo-1,4-beta-xylanase